MTVQISTVRTLDENTFVDRFSPKLNHLDTIASFDFGYGGCLFETYGAELDYVLAQDPRTIWTVLDGDDDLVVIESGFHLVNRIGFILTRRPIEDDENYTVILD